MEVILRRDVEKLGRRGDVVKVKEGYGRNFLLPRIDRYRPERTRERSHRGHRHAAQVNAMTRADQHDTADLAAQRRDGRVSGGGNRT